MSGLRIAVLGAGPMGRLHARTVARGALATGASLVAIVDRHAERAHELAREHGVEARDDLAALPALCIDAAIVAVPTAGHVETALALLEQGLDLLVEKPLAQGVAQGERLVRRAEALGRVLQVGHVEWYNPAWRTALAEVGRPTRIQVRRMQPASERGLDVDVVQDLMLHDLDWVTRAVGEPIDTLEAEGTCDRGRALDRATAWLRFETGCEARLEVSRVHATRERTLEVEGARGRAKTSLVVEPPAVGSTGPMGAAGDGGAVAAPGAAGDVHDPLAQQWSVFVDAVRRRETPECDGWVGLAALSLVARVRERIAASGTHDAGGGRGDAIRLRR